MKKIVLGITLIMLVILTTGCGSKKIIGKWQREKEGSVYYYTFNEDKTCSFEMPGIRMECTYEDNETKVDILFKGNATAKAYEYRIEGSKLIIEDDMGRDVIYEKKD